MAVIHKEANKIVIAAPAIMAAISKRLSLAGRLFSLDLKVEFEEVGIMDV